jgi:regulatory protein
MFPNEILTDQVFVMNRDERKPPDAYARALGLLSRREHSRRELRTKLIARGVESADADSALDRLEDSSYQSDPRFAELLVRSRIAQGRGPVRIQAELRQHGVAEDVVRGAIDAEQPDWSALALDLCRRRFRGPPADYAERVKRANFLARRGFPPSIAREASGSSDADETDLPI